MSNQHEMIKKFDKVLLETAFVFSKMSNCERLKVGAVIAKDGRPLATGYNGTPPGMENCCEEDWFENVCSVCGCSVQNKLLYSEDISKNRCTACGASGVVHVIKKTRTKSNVLHAERNAIYFSAKNGIRIDGCEMYITHSPCIECCNAIITSGVKRVVFCKEYGDSSALVYLADNGVEVLQIYEGQL